MELLTKREGKHHLTAMFQPFAQQQLFGCLGKARTCRLHFLDALVLRVNESTIDQKIHRAPVEGGMLLSDTHLLYMVHEWLRD